MSIKICPKCFSNHSKNGLFCSRSCANSRGKRTEDFKNKVRKKLLGRKKEVKYFKPRHIVYCFICGKSIETTKIVRMTCKSSDCIRKSQSLSGRISANKRVKRSKDEMKLFELIKNKIPTALSNQIIVDGWDCDIAIQELKLAILWNGPWHYRDMKMKNHSLKQVQNRDKIKISLFEKEGWKTLIFRDDLYTPETAFEEIMHIIESMQTVLPLN